ncbi:MAG TPA: electron transporter RnfD [Flavobacterium sp.]|nr:electron transporter RnfD [Flavobacterium sp.]
MQKYIYYVIISWLLINCTSKKNLYVNHSHEKIRYEGRVSTDSLDGTALYWPGSSVSIDFIGTEIYAMLQDENGDNYYNVIVDNQIVNVLNPSSKKENYLLASGLSKGKHRVKLYRKTEFSNGKTIFYNFSLNKKSKILDPEIKKVRKIEFYGDSISAGHGIDDTEGKDRGGVYFNNYLAYSSLTAQYFNAEYRCICKGGIGLMISWFPYTMPDIYNRINPLDPKSTWDFSLYTPDIVVVNLFQNDSWLVKNTQSNEFKAIFGETPPQKEFIVESYKKFIEKLRIHYPKANIICTLGNMDAIKVGSPWPDYIKEAVSKISDSKIHTLFFPYKETPKHPNKEEHQKMSDFLIKFIEENIEF